MPSSHPPHPLRRISTGSLSSLARSQDRTHASPSGLDFLQPALTELADEATTLASNVQRLNELHDALGVFNENFAGYLYALKMNAFCVEWPLAPDQNSFARLPTLAIPPSPEPIIQQLQRSSSQFPHDTPQSPPSPLGGGQHPADMTYATAYSGTTDDAPPPPKKPLGAAKQTAGGGGPSVAARKAALALRKKRELEISGIIDTLPLEYRGSQPSQRMAMEKIIGKLMDNSQGLQIHDMISAPDLPQPRVNKCLIALVAKKLVTKASIEGKTRYQWVGP